MGSVISLIDCPSCGYSECYSDFYYKTGEEYVNCPRCGYHCHVERVPKEWNNMACYKDKDWVEEEIKSVGAFSIIFNGGGTCGPLPDEEARENFIKAFKNGDFINEPGEKASVVTHTFLEDGIWMIEDLVSGLKDTFEKVKK